MSSTSAGGASRGLPTATSWRRLERDRVLVSADTHFGGLLALSGAASPSVVLVRRVSSPGSADLAVLLRANLPLVAADLAAGAVVVLGDDTLRVRRLPLV